MKKSSKLASIRSPTDAALKFIVTFCVVFMDNSDIIPILALDERNCIYKSEQEQMA